MKKKVAIVGKGLTFDSGGYNLKTGAGIEMMKFDMGGAGATLGAAKSIGQIKPEGVEVRSFYFGQFFHLFRGGSREFP